MGGGKEVEGSHIPLSFHIFFRFKLIIKLSSLPFHFFFQFEVVNQTPKARSVSLVLPPEAVATCSPHPGPRGFVPVERPHLRCDFEGGEGGAISSAFHQF